jgi:hypothetical protein
MLLLQLAQFFHFREKGRIPIPNFGSPRRAVANCTACTEYALESFFIGSQQVSRSQTDSPDKTDMIRKTGFCGMLVIPDKASFRFLKPRGVQRAGQLGSHS